MPSEWGGRGAGERLVFFHFQTCKKARLVRSHSRQGSYTPGGTGLYSVAGHPCWGSVHKCIFVTTTSPKVVISQGSPYQGHVEGSARSYAQTPNKSRVPENCWGQTLCDVKCRHRRCWMNILQIDR
jgi:hypothetical protein